MTDTPWQGDACSLVEAFRAGERSPVEELAATYAAIDASALNAFCYTPRDQALETARLADVSLPFGGVPIGVKELDDVEGWPATDACVVFEDRVATQTSFNAQRLRDRGGAVLAGLTTASEFGGVNVTRTVLHGVTRNPWDTAKTPGGSSGGTASAVAGGLITLGTGGDGGGSIRIPAGFTGLFGLKATYGRIPRGPRSVIGNFTVTVGCLSRSVRDTARWFDVANGYDPRDQFSLPRTDGWERDLGTHIESLRGLRVAVVPDWGGAVVAPRMWELLDAAADRLIASTAMVRVDGVDTSLPSMGAAWSISGGIGSYGQLAAFWPDCKDVLTPEIRGSVRVTKERYDLDARVKIEQRRMELNERMAAIFAEVDLVITASNPDVAFAAEGPLPAEFGGIAAGAGNNGRLTFPANMHGNPAVSVPAGTLDGLPIGMQIVGRHYAEQQLLDASLVIERNEPWPLVAPVGATNK
ncbi:MAG: putative amidase [Ilumatobacteraceae bacterium]|nr:putative amidase [Ilumatobacteraceae bacterium]